VAFAVAIMAIKFLLHFYQTPQFYFFGVTDNHRFDLLVHGEVNGARSNEYIVLGTVALDSVKTLLADRKSCWEVRRYIFQWRPAFLPRST